MMMMTVAVLLIVVMSESARVVMMAGFIIIVVGAAAVIQATAHGARRTGSRLLPDDGVLLAQRQGEGSRARGGIGRTPGGGIVGTTAGSPAILGGRLVDGFASFLVTIRKRGETERIGRSRLGPQRIGPTGRPGH